MHVDLRANRSANAMDDAALKALVNSVDVGGRVDRVQLLLDDRVVTVDARR